MLSDKNILYKFHTSNEIVPTKKKQLKTLQNWLTFENKNVKSEYYSKSSMKLSNPGNSSKEYWSILNSFVRDKKIPIISPTILQWQFYYQFLPKSETI